MNCYVLHNTISGKGKRSKSITTIPLPEGAAATYITLCESFDCKAFINSLTTDDTVILCGGDGTLNRFINSIDSFSALPRIYFYAMGSGNDFSNDLSLKAGSTLIPLNDYIQNLPSVTVKGKEYRFINGVGYGMDGYVCYESDRIRQKTGKPMNYTAIAIKGLLWGFKPLNATVTVDGKKFTYKKVWLAPCMKGRFFGGGMMIAPNQDRGNAEGSLTLVVAHDLARLKIAILFLTIFKGKHIKFKKYVTLHTGSEISVSYDSPAPMQIDGEPILDVLSYSVTTKNTEKVLGN